MINKKQMRVWADEAVSLAASSSGEALDYSRSSIGALERSLDALRDTGRDDSATWDLACRFGAYLGEVMLVDFEEFEYRWEEDYDGEPCLITTKLQNGASLNKILPITKCNKYLLSGQNESVAKLYATCISMLKGGDMTENLSSLGIDASKASGIEPSYLLNGRFSANAAAWLLYGDYVFFQQNEILWDGTTHTMKGMQVNAAKVNEIPMLVSNISVLQGMLEFLSELEKDEGLRVPLYMIHPGVQDAIRNEDLTGITLFNLMAQAQALMIKEPEPDHYAVVCDVRLPAGIPAFYQLVARMIWDMRAYNERSGAYEVVFANARNIDADAVLGQVNEMVPGAVSNAIWKVQVSELPQVELPSAEETEAFARKVSHVFASGFDDPLEIQADEQLFETALNQLAREFPITQDIEGTGYMDRTARIEHVRVGDPLVLAGDWENQWFDPVCIEVFNARGETLGNLSNRFSVTLSGHRELACMLPHITATVETVTPKSKRRKNAKYALMDVHMELDPAVLGSDGNLTPEVVEEAKALLELPRGERVLLSKGGIVASQLKGSIDVSIAHDVPNPLGSTFCSRDGGETGNHPEQLVSALHAEEPSQSGGSAPQPANNEGDADLQRKWQQVIALIDSSSPAKAALFKPSIVESDDGSTLSIALPEEPRFKMAMCEREDVRALLKQSIAQVFGPREFVIRESGSASSEPSSGRWTFNERKIANCRRFTIEVPDQWKPTGDPDYRDIAKLIGDDGDESPQILCNAMVGDLNNELVETFRNSAIPEMRIQLARDTVYSNDMLSSLNRVINDWVVEGKNCQVLVFEILQPSIFPGIADENYEYHVKPLAYDHEDFLRLADSWGHLGEGELKELAFGIARTIELDNPIELRRIAELESFCKEPTDFDTFNENVVVVANMLNLASNKRVNAELYKLVRQNDNDKTIWVVNNNARRTQAEGYCASLDDEVAYYERYVQALEKQAEFGVADFGKMWELVGQFGDGRIVDHINMEDDKEAEREINSLGIITIPESYYPLRKRYEALKPSTAGTKVETKATKAPSPAPKPAPKQEKPRVKRTISEMHYTDAIPRIEKMMNEKVTPSFFIETSEMAARALMADRQSACDSAVNSWSDDLDNYIAIARESNSFNRIMCRYYGYFVEALEAQASFGCTQAEIQKMSNEVSEFSELVAEGFSCGDAYYDQIVNSRSPVTRPAEYASIRRRHLAVKGGLSGNASEAKIDDAAMRKAEEEARRKAEAEAEQQKRKEELPARKEDAEERAARIKLLIIDRLKSSRMMKGEVISWVVKSQEDGPVHLRLSYKEVEKQFDELVRDDKLNVKWGQLHSSTYSSNGMIHYRYRWHLEHVGKIPDDVARMDAGDRLQLAYELAQFQYESIKKNDGTGKFILDSGREQDVVDGILAAGGGSTLRDVSEHLARVVRKEGLNSTPSDMESVAKRVLGNLRSRGVLIREGDAYYLWTQHGVDGKPMKLSKSDLALRGQIEELEGIVGTIAGLEEKIDELNMEGKALEAKVKAFGFFGGGAEKKQAKARIKEIRVQLEGLNAERNSAYEAKKQLDKVRQSFSVIEAGRNRYRWF